MKLGKEVVLGPGHTVLDEDPATPPKRGKPPPIFGLRQLWPNGWMDQDKTWYGGRPRPWPHCVRWGLGTQLRSPKGAQLLQFSAYVYCGQTVAHVSYCWALVNPVHMVTFLQVLYAANMKCHTCRIVK